jgi:NTE family protein
MAQSQFRNLVFEGGGVKGIAYAGAIEVFEKHGWLSDIERVGGTSAGAITATLLAMGAGSADIAEIVGGTDFRDFMDDSFFIVRDAERLVNDFGWYKGDEFSRWIKKLVYDFAGDPELTFRHLAERAFHNPKRFRKLYVIGSNLSLQLPQVFSADDTPDVALWEAVRISMSIPLFFACVRRNGEVNVDGGVTWNYPLDLFDHRKFVSDPAHFVDPKKEWNYPTVYDARHVYNKETLGFRVDTVDEIAAEKKAWRSPPQKIESILDYAGALMSFMIDTANKMHLHANDWHRTVFIDAKGVKATDFKLSREKVAELVESGRESGTRYLKWFEDPHENPINRANSGAPAAPARRRPR